MVFYSVIMFAGALLFFGVAAAIYRGNTSLIHSYHQTHVEEADKKKYGEAFSKGLFALAIAMVFSGVIALFGETVLVAVLSVGVLLAGMAVSFLMLTKVQKKFNGGFIR